MSALVFEKVTKSYRRGGQETQVLKALDFQAEEGEFIALMGPSGSGKTTFLNMAGALDQPDSGEVRVLGTALRSLNSGARADWRAAHLGFVFQFYHLLPFLSAAENVEVPLSLLGLSGAERGRRVSVALRLVGVEECATRRPGQLSGGQQQRVAIARAIAADPRLLLCDEPTGDLDRDAAQEILELLAALNKQHGKTILMVTHDPVAAGYANRRVRLERGVISSQEYGGVLAAG
jgi:putative ABC transport system ATP-binding protein